MARGQVRRQSERGVYDRNGTPVQMLYVDATDTTKMARGTASGAILVDIASQTLDQIHVIQETHEMIHDGVVYMVERNDTLANTDQINIILTTPNTTEEQHIIWTWYAGGEVNFVVKEGVTYDSSGLAFTPINRNRRSSNTSNCTGVKVGSDGAASDLIVYTGGTIIENIHSGSGKTEASIGADRNEMILDTNTSYIFEITAETGPIDVQLILEWYEVTP